MKLVMLNFQVGFSGSFVSLILCGSGVDVPPWVNAYGQECGGPQASYMVVVCPCCRGRMFSFPRHDVFHKWWYPRPSLILMVVKALVWAPLTTTTDGQTTHPSRALFEQTVVRVHLSM